MINHPVSQASQEPLLYFYELYKEKGKEGKQAEKRGRDPFFLYVLERCIPAGARDV